MPLYKEMTPTQRYEAFADAADAVENHVLAFALRPYRGSRACNDAMRHADAMEARMKLIYNIGRKLGDDWIKRVISPY